MAALLLLAAAPGASATAVDADLHSAGPWSLAGNLTETAGLTQALYDGAAATPLHMSGSLHYQQIAFDYVESAAPAIRIPLQSRVLAQGDSGTAAFEVGSPASTLLALAAGAQPLSANLGSTAALAAIPFTPQGFLQGRYIPDSGTYGTTPHGPCGMTASPIAIPALSGDARVLLHGGHVVLDRATLASGTDRGVPGLVTETVVLVTGDAAMTPTAGWRACVATLGAQGTGHLVMRGVTGTARLDATVYNSTAAVLDAQGRFRISATYSETGAAWRVQGDLSAISLEGTSLLARAEPWLAAGGLAAGAGALLLAVRTLAVLAAANRVRRAAKPHPTRSAILDYVSRWPGCTIGEVARSLRVSKTTGRFHVRVLQRAGLLAGQKPGMSEVLHVSTGGTAPRDLEAMALLHHPIRGRIFSSLRVRGALDYAALQRDWTERGWPASSHPLVLYHARVMEKKGLVQRTGPSTGAGWRIADGMARLAPAPSIAEPMAVTAEVAT